jgi:mannose-6-phosphate isomerase-like protein (cupin superfamily)
MRAEEQHRRSFKEPDKRQVKRGVQVEIVRLGDMPVKRASYPPGWRFSKDSGLRRCMDTHVGYVVAGTMHLQLNDGTEFDCQAGDAIAVPAGHDSWVVGHEPFVFIQFDEGSSAAARFGVFEPALEKRAA